MQSISQINVFSCFLRLSETETHFAPVQLLQKVSIFQFAVYFDHPHRFLDAEANKDFNTGPVNYHFWVVFIFDFLDEFCRLDNTVSTKPNHLQRSLSDIRKQLICALEFCMFSQEHGTVSFQMICVKHEGLHWQFPTILILFDACHSYILFSCWFRIPPPPPIPSLFILQSGWLFRLFLTNPTLLPTCRASRWRVMKAVLASLPSPIRSTKCFASLPMISSWCRINQDLNGMDYLCDNNSFVMTSHFHQKNGTTLSSVWKWWHLM